MLNKLLIFLGLTCATPVLAQQPTNTKTTQNPNTEIDYKQVGAPMPPLTLFMYQDTIPPTAITKSKSKKDKEKAKIKGAAPQARMNDKVLMTEKDFDNGANLFIMMFNPTCAHCEDMTMMLGKNINLFKKSQIILMSTMMMRPYLSDFVNMLKVNEYPQMYIGSDSSSFVNNTFTYQQLPQINIYSGDRKLLRIFSGEVPMDSLKKYMQ